MKPRWYFFAWFAVLAAVHLVAEGWTDTAAIGLPVGFAATLVLVFVPRLPWWATGEARTGSTARGVKVAGFGVLWLLVAAAIVAGLVEHPPHGRDVWYAAVFIAIFAGASVFGLVRLLPKRPLTRRAALRRRLVFATAAAWAAGVFVLSAEVGTIVAGGWLPWILPVPGVLVVLGLAAWRYDLAGPARCLASGDWTPVAAAALDVRPGEPVNGWAVLPGDVRLKFHFPAVPADIAAELADRRRLWLAGWPSDELVAGLPDGDSYAVGLIGVHRDGGKNTVPAGPAAR